MNQEMITVLSKELDQVKQLLSSFVRAQQIYNEVMDARLHKLEGTTTVTDSNKAESRTDETGKEI